MEQLIPRASDLREIERLKELLPPELQLAVSVIACKPKNRTLIATRKLAKNQFSVQIDLQQWCFLTLAQRNLLFWHEVARIQNRSFTHSSWELIAITIGLSAALMELISQNLFSFVVTLTVTGLTTYKLYQRQLGEQGLREITAADQTAIALAVQAGYSWAEAYESLYEGLKMLTQQPAQKAYRSQYEMRLQVLEMVAKKEDESSEPFTLFKSLREPDRIKKKVQIQHFNA